MGRTLVLRNDVLRVPDLGEARNEVLQAKSWAWAASPSSPSFGHPAVRGSLHERSAPSIFQLREPGRGSHRSTLYTHQSVLSIRPFGGTGEFRWEVGGGLSITG